MTQRPPMPYLPLPTPRVSYRLRGKIRHGRIVGWSRYPGKAEVIVIKDDASGREHRVLPQWIITD